MLSAYSNIYLQNVSLTHLNNLYGDFGKPWDRAQLTLEGALAEYY